ncbi:MAG: fibronectin type III domain-containing protein, partial [Candidatus Cloacimonetes bacterium]|nr:fibronectin type III domain-containing protein [Candidatus Cloacimonadota bacterium]
MKKFIFIMVLMSCFALMLSANYFTDNGLATSENTIMKKSDFVPTPRDRSMDPVRNPGSRNLLVEGFEGTTGMNLPTGWTKVGATGEQGWRTIENGESLPGVEDEWVSHDGVRALARGWQQSGSANWVFSSGFTLTAGSSIAISFWVQAPGYSSLGEWDDIEVKIGQTATAAGMASAPQVWSNVGTRIGDWTLITQSYTPTTAGTYYLAFHDLSATGTGIWLGIDDVFVGNEGPGIFLPPTNLTATGASMAVDLSWTAPAENGDNLAGYRIFRNNVAIVPDVSPTATTYHDSPLPNGVEVSYFVRAVYTMPAGVSDPTATVTATPVGGEFINNPPRNLTEISGDSKVTLSWQEPATHNGLLAGYQVYRNGALLTQIIATTGFTDVPLVNGVPYEYTVVAVYEFPAVTSAHTDPVVGTPEGSASGLHKPTNLTTPMTLPGSVTLSWDVPVYSSEGGTMMSHVTSEEWANAY